jgi:hypothetical protein
LKKLTAIFFLSVFAGSWISVPFFFRLQQLSIRHEIKNCLKLGVAEDQLAKIKVTIANRDSLEWEHDREFRYHGDMFDVVRISAYNDTIIYYCIADKNETLLFARLDEMTWKQVNANGNGKQLKNIFRILANMYPEPADITWSSNSQGFVFLPSPGSNYSSFATGPSNPPPELV